MFRTVWDYIEENRKLKVENEKLQTKVILSESQNYCKICGNILDGYIPPEKKSEGLE